MSQQPEWEDYLWLISPAARTWLERAGGDARSLVARTQALRAELGPARTHLVLELVELRTRAAAKFSHAAAMFFTRRLLEQATDEALGAYKARRFPQGPRLLDLCCGLGGDLLPLAGRGPVVGVDRDRLALLYAAANCRVCDVEAATFLEADVATADVSSYAAWHLDPDRRPDGRRTTRVELQTPGIAVVQRLLAANGNAAFKLAPASLAPADWQERAELEWLESRGECRQQVAWFGELARTPGLRRATVVPSTASAAGSPPADAATICGPSDVAIPVVSRVGRYLLEPHAAVLAARLTGVLAGQLGLATLSPHVGYLTGDSAAVSPLGDGFEVLQTMPFDLKRLTALLRQQEVGRLEIKVRGLALDPALMLKKLKLAGAHSATLLLMPHGRSALAVLAQRVRG